jgi:uncharacterized protein involved in type VI secretion and phage assembly
MAASTQATMPIQVTTPFGDDKLLLRAFHGEDRISGLFRYTLTPAGMHGMSFAIEGTGRYLLCSPPLRL